MRASHPRASLPTAAFLPRSFPTPRQLASLLRNLEPPMGVLGTGRNADAAVAELGLPEDLEGHVFYHDVIQARHDAAQGLGRGCGSG